MPRDLCHHKQEWGKKRWQKIKKRLYQRYGGRGIAVSPLRKRSLTTAIIKQSYRNPGNVMTGKCMVQQTGVKREDIVPLHQEPWCCGLVLEKNDKHHKQLGITHLYSPYSWANGLVSFQLLQLLPNFSVSPPVQVKCFLGRVTKKISISWGKAQSLLLCVIFLYMQAHMHSPHLLTCSKVWIKSHGWQSEVAALQRQAKPNCIKPEHRAPWAWPVKCYHTHLPAERLGFITHIRWWLSGPVHLRPELVSWFRFCHRSFVFLARTAGVKCC